MARSDGMVRVGAAVLLALLIGIGIGAAAAWLAREPVQDRAAQQQASVPLPTPQDDPVLEGAASMAPASPRPDATARPGTGKALSGENLLLGEEAALPAYVDEQVREEGAQLAALPAPESRPAPALPAWRRNAVAVAVESHRPMVAIVIDDLGLDHGRTRRTIALPAPLTLAFLPYGNLLEEETAAARNSGHELMVHMPMEPQGRGINPGPDPLLTSLPPDEIRARLDRALKRFTGYVGINNHMGSWFTSQRVPVETVMAELKARGLLFLDSRTAGGTVAAAIAAEYGVPVASRDVFLDDTSAREGVMAKLEETEAIARRSGTAVAIGHPHDDTLAALAEWMPAARARGVQFVPVSALVATGRARTAGAARR